MKAQMQLQLMDNISYKMKSNDKQSEKKNQMQYLKHIWISWTIQLDSMESNGF